MADELKITISAQDNASAVFKKIATEAEKVADNLEKAGKDGGKGFDEVAKGADKAETALLQLSQSGSGVIRSLNDGASAADEFGNNLLQLGSGLQSVGDAMDSLGQSALDQQRQIMALNQLYGDASQQYQDFARQIQSTTIFSDDQVRQAEIYFATLKNNYDLTDAQIQNLVQISADLATVHGMSLEDASLRIQAAIRGEGEAAEALGLTMNQQAIDRDNLTLTMSNQEAAQFRLNALLQQTGNVTGASTQYVQTANGQWQQFKNTMQDAGQTVGSVVGPFGDIFSTLGRGVATVGDATRGFGEIKNGLTGLVGVVRNSSAAMSLLTLATNPVTLAIGAVGAAAIAGIAIWHEYNSSLDGVTAKFGDLEQAQQNALLNGDAARARAIEGTVTQLHTVEQAINDALTIGPNGPSIPVPSDGMYEQVLGSITKALSDSRVDVGLYSTFLAEEFQKIYDDPSKAGEVFNEIINVSTNELGRFSSEAAKAAAAVQQITQFIGEFEASLVRANTQLADNGRLASATGDAIAELMRAQTGEYPAEDATRRYNDLLKEQTRLEHELGEAIESGNTKAIQEKTNALEAVNTEIEKQNAALAKNLALRAQLANTGLIDSGFAGVDEANAGRAEERAARWAVIGTAAGNQVAAASERAAVAAAQATIAFEGGAQALNATASAAEKAAAKVEAINEAQKQVIADYLQMTGNDDFVSQLNLAGLGTEYTQLAGNIADASRALDDGFRVIVGNTNAIAQQSQGIQDWADKLIGVQGEYGQIDDLLAAGTISLNEYNAAQQAQIGIAEANASIQQDVLTIQAKQAPLLAELSAQQAAYMDQLAQEPAQQQLIALGWMDSTESARAYTIMTQAAAVANGELGAGAEAAFSQMIQGAVAADPILGALLEDMGLISIGADGTVTVHLEGAQSTMATLDDLNDTLMVIADLLDNGKLDGSINIKVENRNEIEQAKRDLEAMGGQTYNATVNAAGNANEKLTETRILGEMVSSTPVKVNMDDEGVDQTMHNLDELDGRVVTVTVGVEGGAGEALGGQLGAIAGKGVHVPTVLDPPTEAPDASGLPPVEVAAHLSFDMGEAAGSSAVNAAQNALGDLQDIKVTVTATADIGEAVIGLYNLQTQADTLNTTAVSIPVSISMDSTTLDVPSWLSPWLPSDNPTGGAAGGDLISVDVTLEATDNASGPVEDVKTAIEAIPTSHTTTISEVGSGAVIGLAGATTNAINNIPLSHSTSISLIGAESAIGLAQAVSNTINAIPTSKTSTINVVTAYSTTGTPSGGGITAVEHGGLLSYATGGLIPHIAGEGNRPEIAHYANGGMALLPYEGLYANPPGTYISPAPANPGAGTGGFVVNFNGNFYGSNRQELNDWAAKDLLPGLAAEMTRHLRAQGVNQP